jgi:hypothetical protein
MMSVICGRLKIKESMYMEKTVRNDKSGKTRGLLPVFYLLSLIFCLLAACENAAKPVVTVVTVGGDEDADLAEDGPPEEPPEENPDPPHIGGGEGEYPGVKVKSVTLDVAEIELAVGDTYQLTATANPPEAPVTWFSRKASAVSVDGTGLVTRQGLGAAEVVAKAGGKSAVCAVLTAGAKSAGLYQIVNETEEDEIDLSARTEDTMLAKALAYIKASGEDDARYEIVLDEDVADTTGAGYTIGTGPSGSSTGGRTNLSITVRGVEDSTVTIAKDAAGPLFTVYGDIGDTPELVLENITLAGYSENNSALVVVGGGNGKPGTLAMNEGCRVTGNTTSSSGGGIGIFHGSTLYMRDGRIDNNHAEGASSSFAFGGGVNNAGLFEMSGGYIENNTAGTENTTIGSNGGGVYSSGAFTMSGGSIENNHCVATTGDYYDYCIGGGVYARNFTMSSEARIANNSAANGGGVAVAGTFTMGGGTVRGNRAVKSGAGVFVYTIASFTKSGGVIYGIEGADANKAADGITGTVHAIEVMQGLGQEVTTKYYLDTNVGEDVHLDSAESTGWQQ